jgi:hypothetical protein
LLSYFRNPSLQGDSALCSSECLSHPRPQINFGAAFDEAAAAAERDFFLSTPLSLSPAAAPPSTRRRRPAGTPGRVPPAVKEEAEDATAAAADANGGDEAPELPPQLEPVVRPPAEACAGGAGEAVSSAGAGAGCGSGAWGLTEAANLVLHRELLDGINTWDSGRLQTLKGIGRQRAARIIQLREEGDGGKGRALRHLGELEEIGMTAKQIETLYLLIAG